MYFTEKRFEIRFTLRGGGGGGDKTESLKENWYSLNLLCSNAQIPPCINRV